VDGTHPRGISILGGATGLSRRVARAATTRIRVAIGAVTTRICCPRLSGKWLLRGWMRTRRVSSYCSRWRRQPKHWLVEKGMSSFRAAFLSALPSAFSIRSSFWALLGVASMLVLFFLGLAWVALHWYDEPVRAWLTARNKRKHQPALGLAA
jgi:hypothetical protein